MNTVFVLIGGLGIFDLVFLGEIGIGVTRRARVRQIEFEHRRIRLLDRDDFVPAVAAPAFCRS